MGFGHGIKVARRSLGYLAMQDELKNRMELASGAIRELTSSSKSPETSKKTQHKIDRFCMAFDALKNGLYEPRELEILSSKLVEICADVIEENSKAQSKK